MIIADSHEFLELYRGDKDLRMGIEMLKLDPTLRFVSFAPDRPSPNDAVRFGITRTADGPLPDLPEGFDLRLLASRALRFSKKESGGIVSWMPGYGRALREAAPDVIFENPFSWLTPRSYQTHRAARRLGAPVIYYDPGDDIPISTKQRLLVPVERPVIHSAAHIITYNDAGRRRFETKYGYPGGRISVVPKPVDVDGCRYVGDTTELRARLSGGDPSQLLVAYLGRLARYKGSRVLLEVARGAMTDPACSTCRFVFLGGALSTDEDERDYDLPNTHVTGMVPHADIAMHLAACDVVVFPDITRPGGFPTAVAEAMAASKALIVGVGRTTDYLPLTDGVDAMLVEPGSPDAIAVAVRRLAQDGGLRARLGRAVGEFASCEMDYPVVARRYLETARQVSGRA